MTLYQPPLCIIPETSAQEFASESLGSILVLAVDYDVILTEWDRSQFHSTVDNNHINVNAGPLWQNKTSHPISRRIIQPVGWKHSAPSNGIDICYNRWAHVFLCTSTYRQTHTHTQKHTHTHTHTYMTENFTDHNTTLTLIAIDVNISETT